MRILDAYYLMRPYLARSTQIRIRRWFALRKREQVKDVWPILESAGRRPDGWPGWPDGKQFAFVLTHDVEAAEGVAKCRQLMDLEESLGFRSSFNFVAEDYEVPPDLREEMTRRGFEVGLHGLHHDGRTFKNRTVFDARVPRINRYLKDWKAVGFRAPLMMHNLDWTRELNIEYDSSTFDTDPFEPQPDGAGTIFPFWVDGDGAFPGYVELPYTLPQDFALFVIQQEASIDIWIRKLDWIAAKGGMALLNTHSDFMSFDGKSHVGTFDVSLYRRFLEHVKGCFAGNACNMLPRDVASYTKSLASRPCRRTPLRVCMLAYAFLDNDTRILRYIRALADRGDHVDVICLGRHGQPRRETRDGTTVYRLQRRVRDERWKLTYLVRILRFWARSCITVTVKHLRAPYDVVHVHSVPDFEVFAAWLPRITGAKVILDIHDIVPEFFISKFNLTTNSIYYRLLLAIERASAAFASHVIIANHLWYTRLTVRSVRPEKCTAFPNYLASNIFSRHGDRSRHDGKFVVIYTGGLQKHQGLHVAIRAFEQVAKAAPEARFLIHGEGPEEGSLRQLASDLGLKEKVAFEPFVPLESVPGILSNADLGVVPKLADGFGNEAFSTKIYEYMSQGLPVLCSRTAVDSYYFKDSDVMFFESGNERQMAEAMLTLIRDGALRQKLRENGLRCASQNSWAVKSKCYLDLIDGLTAGKRNHV